MNYYSEVIGALQKLKNHEQVLIEVAKKHPKYVLEAHLKVNGKTNREKILYHYLNGHSKFECVQLYRLITSKKINHCVAAVEMILPAIKEKKKK